MLLLYRFKAASYSMVFVASRTMLRLVSFFFEIDATFLVEATTFFFFCPVMDDSLIVDGVAVMFDYLRLDVIAVFFITGPFIAEARFRSFFSCLAIDCC